MGYTWGYLRKAAIYKLDLDEQFDDPIISKWQSRFTTYANEVITQVCSTIKPKPCYFTFTCEEKDFVNGEYRVDVTNTDFVSFSDNRSYITITQWNPYKQENETKKYTLTDEWFRTIGYNTIVVKTPGTYNIAYNGRWIDFAIIQDNLADDTYLDVPNDILDCIPSYIAAQLYGIDDEYKAAKYRNEFEMLYARIDSKPAEESTGIGIKGDW